MPTSPSASSRSLLSIAAVLALAGAHVETSNAASRPAHFDANASVDLGDGLACVVGNATDADGMNARAWVTVEDKATHKVRWAAPVALAKGWYQNQATHCLKNGKHVQALIQSDTASEACTAQTFVDVASFDEATGRLLAVAPVTAPGVHGRVSLLVGKDNSNFRLKDGRPVVTGTWSMKSVPIMRQWPDCSSRSKMRRNTTRYRSTASSAGTVWMSARCMDRIIGCSPFPVFNQRP